MDDKLRSAIIQLWKQKGMEIEDIAEELDISKQTVKSVLSKRIADKKQAAKERYQS